MNPLIQRVKNLRNGDVLADGRQVESTRRIMVYVREYNPFFEIKFTDGSEELIRGRDVVELNIKFLSF